MPTTKAKDPLVHSLRVAISDKDRDHLIALAKKQRVSMGALIREALYKEGLLEL